MKHLFIVFSLILLASCSSSLKDTEVSILKVALEETPVSIKDLFSKIEIVPLETTDSSLLVHILRVREDHGNYYLLSEDYPAFNHITLMAFDGQGNYIRSIGKVGQGPEEYPWLIYDAAIDSPKEIVYMMSPSGMIYIYRLDGSFVRKMMLPDKGVYHGLQLLDENRLLAWSALDIEENALTIVDTDSAALINDYWKDYHCLNWAALSSFSCQNGGKTYFTPAVYNKVFEVTPDSLILAYQWDFGKDNIDMDKYRLSLPEDRKAASDEWDRLRKDGSVPYKIEKQGQTRKYYYATLFYSFDKEKHLADIRSIFYEKETGRTFCFKETTEGIRINPELIETDYMLALMPTEDLEMLLPVLDEKEKAKIARRVEDDNPCLVKFIF